ncbi:MAG: ATP synthase subunit I [Alphaproteobacteria bacterium]|nr:ATP synthase subunit I [Alphaproteobacteria bacterium]
MMMMTDGFMAIVAVLAGLALGTVFFVGLWWTVRRALTAQQPGLLVLGSMLARTGLVVVGFYSVSDGNWKQLLFCLAGFIIARLIWVRVLPKTQAVNATAILEGTRHAP